jgi:hypothetical protein
VTATSYNEDRVLTAYLCQYYRHLFTELERKVDLRIKVEMKSKRLDSEVRAERIARYCGPPDPQVDSALKQGHLAFFDRVRARILAEEADQVFINRCPICQRIARTPKARQCMWCHYDWVVLRNETPRI